MSLLYELASAKRKFHQKLFALYLRSCLQHLGRDTRVDPSLWIENPEKIYVGDQVEIRRGVVMLGRSDLATGIYLDKGVHIKEYAYLDAYMGNIFCGEGVRIGHHAVIAGHGGVRIGKWSGIAGLSYVIAANHDFSDPSRPFVQQQETKKGITIGEFVWGGSGVIILDGVTIGDHAVIGAGSVVRRDVEPYSVVLGNPARTAYSFQPGPMQATRSLLDQRGT